MGCCVDPVAVSDCSVGSVRKHEQICFAVLVPLNGLAAPCIAAINTYNEDYDIRTSLLQYLCNVTSAGNEQMCALQW